MLVRGLWEGGGGVGAMAVSRLIDARRRRVGRRARDRRQHGNGRTKRRYELMRVDRWPLTNETSVPRLETRARVTGECVNFFTGLHGVRRQSK